MPESGYFTPELFHFLRQLKRNNDREWFARNQARFVETVRDPALRFIAAFAPALAKLSPHFRADPRPTRGSLFRIYRDTRFAADKRPFKTHVGILFSHARGKDVHAPIFYLHLEPGGCFVAGGVWHPDGPALARLRAAIVRRPEPWKKASRKLELSGESLIRPPRGFDPQHPLIEDIKRKDFVATEWVAEEQVCRPGFLKAYAGFCRKFAPLVEFTAQALGLEY
jgi:uncharacterized protein (TIGR02453 family)